MILDYDNILLSEHTEKNLDIQFFFNYFLFNPVINIVFKMNKKILQEKVNAENY